MSKPTDIRCIGARLYFLPIHTRVPLKFGPETVTSVTCARACVKVVDSQGRISEGWGETPLSVQWVWPSSLPYEERYQVLKQFTIELAEAFATFPCSGHPLEVGSDFQHNVLPQLLKTTNDQRAGKEPMPWLAALVCCSVFDIALHDAFGNLHNVPAYKTYSRDFFSRDLGQFLTPADSTVSFNGRYPAEFLVEPAQQLPAWHLVAGLDPLDETELTGKEPKDGYPVTLIDWIKTDGLKYLKVKLRGNDAQWDYQRLVKVGQIALAKNITALSADFNCTVNEPAYVNEILDRLRLEHRQISDLILYVEQPFPYELEHHRIDVHSVSERKPLFLDESAHDWKLIRLGRELGWNGVALKTCKTQSGAILSACWAKAHGMQLMVQDLSNPMLAQIPHLLLAANVGTIAGVETNGMQFYPQASEPEAVVHPGLYSRRNGSVDLSTISGTGFGYRLQEMRRELPAPAAVFQ